MKKLLVVIFCLTLFMVAHATVKEVAIEYLTAEQVNPEQWRLYGGKELQTVNGLNLYDFHARWQDYATCWFTTQDPLAEKTPWNSPYGYCSGNPINKIDPTGMADIYMIKNNEAILIGNNGIKDDNIYIVKGDTAKEISKASKNEGVYLGDLVEGDDVVKIPTKTLMEGVVESVEQSQDSQRENGGHAMIGEEFVVHWDEGGEPNSSDNISRMSIKPFKVNGITRIPNNVGNVAFYWHIHPNCNIQGDNSFGSSKPSNADIKYQRDMQQSGYKGNAFVIGLNKSQVTFYNKNGEIITLPYSVFKDLGEK